MNRTSAIQNIQTQINWDIIIIGGGATGLGIAVDAAQRGYKTLLVEQYDFAKGTSSKATKLVHGGVRYMAQGNIKLVKDALKERAYLLQNAAHLCHTQNFIIPCYSFWQKIKYGIGLKIYDALSGKYSLGKTQILSRQETKVALKIEDVRIKGGVLYKDGQFDDARLAINLAQTATDLGATVINYCKVIKLKKTSEKVSGIAFEDVINKKNYEASAAVVINATGIFVDTILQMADATNENIVQPSQGIHLVVSKKHFDTAEALMIPQTKDGRVLFAVPWHGHVVIGTTDTPINRIEAEPKALQQEIDFVLAHFNTYTKKQLMQSDVLSVFAGLRPLIKKKDVKSTAALSRDHFILHDKNGLWTITGGKWTTYRKMAQDILDNIGNKKVLPAIECATQNLSIYGSDLFPATEFSFDELEIGSLEYENYEWHSYLLPELHYTWAHVVFSVRNEMAQTVEDILARRTRILFLNAKAAIDLAPKVAAILAAELAHNAIWQEQQVAAFINLAKEKYLI